MTREQETQFVEAAKSGDSGAFEQLMLANQKIVYNIALRMTGNEDDAFDVSQDTFLKAWRSISGFRGDSRFSAWVYKLASNTALDLLRQRKRSQADSLTITDDEGEDSQFDVPDERFSPQNELERRELQAVVRRGLAALPEDSRNILVLRELSGMSYEEIGRILGLEEGTVKSRLFRARKKLCTIISADGNFSCAVSSTKTAEEV